MEQLCIHGDSEMTKKKNKFNLRSYINIGTVVFALIVIYLTACWLRYVTKKPMAVYEVSNSEISDMIRGNGIILREEKVYQTTEEGYVNSYLSDGDRVRNNGIVYTIDKTGEVQKEVNQLLEENEQSNELEIDKIQDDLDIFSESYNDSDFYMVSEVKNELNHDIVSYKGNILSKYKSDLEKKFGKDCYIEVRSPASGLVSYSSDGLEGLTVDDVNKELFHNTTHHMAELRTDELKKSGSDAYRLTTSQKWKIVLPLSDDDYQRIQSIINEEVKEYEEKKKEKEDQKESQKEETREEIIKKLGLKLDICIEKDDLELSVPFDCFQKDDQNYLVLNMENYVQRYLNQRYLQVKILLIKRSGLKIPSSSLVERPMYRVPKSYLIQGSNSNKLNHLNLIYINKEGKRDVKQVKIRVVEREAENENILNEEEKMVTFFCEEVKVGDQIRNTKSKTTYTISKEYTGYGVYTVNSGYAIYEYVDIVRRNEDYCIVNEKNSEIRLYDRIILNSSDVKENDIIY